MQAKQGWRIRRSIPPPCAFPRLRQPNRPDLTRRPGMHPRSRAYAGIDSIKSRKLDTVICREAADKELVDPPVPEVFGQPGRTSFAVIKKTAVAIDSRINSLSEDFAKAFGAKLGGESRTGRPLD